MGWFSDDKKKETDTSPELRRARQEYERKRDEAERAKEKLDREKSGGDWFERMFGF